MVKSRTAQAHQIRGILAEHGLVVSPRISAVRAQAPELLDEAAELLLSDFREVIFGLLDHLKSLDHRVRTLERQIQVWHRDNALSLKHGIPGTSTAAEC